MTVETANVATSTSNLNTYHVFDGLMFDQLTMPVDSFDNALMIVNLQTLAAVQVPEPAG